MLKSIDLSFKVIVKSFSIVNSCSFTFELFFVMPILLLFRLDLIEAFKLDYLLSSMLYAIGGLIFTGSDYGTHKDPFAGTYSKKDLIKSGKMTIQIYNFNLLAHHLHHRTFPIRT